MMVVAVVFVCLYVIIRMRIRVCVCVRVCILPHICVSNVHVFFTFWVKAVILVARYLVKVHLFRRTYGHHCIRLSYAFGSICTFVFNYRSFLNYSVAAKRKFCAHICTHTCSNTFAYNVKYLSTKYMNSAYI